MLFALSHDLDALIDLYDLHPTDVREPMEEDVDYETLDELIATAERDDEDAIGLERSAEWDAESEREAFESRRWLR